MTIALDVVSQLSDQDLLVETESAAARERSATAQLIALLIEVDDRRLYLPQGFSSLFTYCTQALHLSEHAAYRRIEAARTARRFPVILERLADGRVNLTAIGLLSPHLTSADHLEVLDAASHKSKREIEHLVAQMSPRPDAPSILRKLPQPKGADVPFTPTLVEERATSNVAVPLTSTRPAPAANVKPLAPERYKIQFTVGRETYDELRRVQDLMRHAVPSGDPGAIFGRALKLLLAELMKRRVAVTERPQMSRAHNPTTSRHIPAAVRREVWRRDGGQCAFTGAQGRCKETGFLEFHHVVPFADGGETTSANLELRCRAHNAYEADRWFGPPQEPLVREEREVYGL